MSRDGKQALVASGVVRDRHADSGRSPRGGRVGVSRPCRESELIRGNSPTDSRHTTTSRTWQPPAIPRRERQRSDFKLASRQDSGQLTPPRLAIASIYTSASPSVGGVFAVAALLLVRDLELAERVLGQSVPFRVYVHVVIIGPRSGRRFSLCRR